MFKRGNGGQVMPAEVVQSRLSADPRAELHDPSLYENPRPIRGSRGSVVGGSAGLNSAAAIPTQLFGSPFGRSGGGGSHGAAAAATPPRRHRNPLSNEVNIVMSPSFRGKVKMGECSSAVKSRLHQSSLREGGGGGGGAGPAITIEPHDMPGSISALFAATPPPSARKSRGSIDNTRLSPDKAARKRRPSRPSSAFSSDSDWHDPNCQLECCNPDSDEAVAMAAGNRAVFGAPPAPGTPVHKPFISFPFGGDGAGGADPLNTTSRSVASSASTTQGKRGRRGSSADTGPPPELSEVKVFVATWNMNNLKDSGGDSLEDLLGIGHREHDIFVVGTQEFGSTLFVWRDLLLKAAGPSHTLLHAQQLEGIKMVIIIRKSLRRYAHSIESAEIATKLGGLIKTKGGVGITFKLGPTSFLFINSHLAAHQKKVADRNADYHTICKGLGLPLNLDTSRNLGLITTPSRARDRRGNMVYDHFDNTFWMGDLNYRIDCSRARVIGAITDGTISTLMEHDQLRREQDAGRVFKGFTEPPVAFLPTYKFDRGTDVFDSSAKQRVPAWTDRILYRSKAEDAIECHCYEAVPELKSSDHRPVMASFSVGLHQGNMIPCPSVGYQTASTMLGMLHRHKVERGLLSPHEEDEEGGSSGGGGGVDAGGKVAAKPKASRKDGSKSGGKAANKSSVCTIS